jgi:uncharacterized protein with HEPN domain
MERHDEAILKKIQEECSFLAKSAEGLNLEAFLNNVIINRAVCMTLINIGELVKNLTSHFRNIHLQIPWRSIAGLRDIAAHGYFSLRMDDIWKYAVEDIPKISRQSARQTQRNNVEQVTLFDKADR